jgi:CrcB protein
MLWWAVGAAAALGAMARYVVDQVIQHQHDMTFPVGTFVINVVGSFVLGLVTGLAAHHGLPQVATTLVGIGVCGGFTTWSTYCWETLALAETGALAEASLNILGSLAAGFAAAAAGLGLAQL